VDVGDGDVCVTVGGLVLVTEIRVGVAIGALDDAMNSSRQSKRRVERRMMFW